MRDLWKYLLVGLVVFGLVFFTVLSLIFVGDGWNGMMGNWGRLPMMGGYGIMGIFMILFMVLLPLAAIALIVGGVAAFMRRPTQIMPPPQNTVKTCPSCGKPVQADWQNCPYCRQNL
jgi:uncharacterized membrane protein